MCGCPAQNERDASSFWRKSRNTNAGGSPGHPIPVENNISKPRNIRLQTMLVMNDMRGRGDECSREPDMVFYLSAGFTCWGGRLAASACEVMGGARCFTFLFTLLNIWQERRLWLSAVLFTVQLQSHQAGTGEVKDQLHAESPETLPLD